MKITFIIYEGCSLSGVLSLIDAFTIANLWHFKICSDNECSDREIRGDSGSISSSSAGVGSRRIFPEPLFETEIVSEGGAAVCGNNGITITPHRAMESVDKSDFVLIPGAILSYDAKADPSSDVLDWITMQHQRGSSIGALCTGTFTLALTGLLDGRIATTNWQLVRRFRKRFPAVHLRPEKVLTVDNNLICSGAVTSIYHIGLYIIEKYGSPQLSSICSKAFMVDSGRESQLPYTAADFLKKHGDREILKAQTLMESRYSETITMDDVASHVGLSPRHFKRRFKSATGETPLGYLQQLRIEAAKNRLETTNDNINEITWQIGYEDISTFRRLFKKHTSLSPKEYRERFMASRSFYIRGSGREKEVRNYGNTELAV